MSADNYIITTAKVKEPPVSFFSKLKFLGPGFILSASIVGSGELIATTILGARAGFIMFWIVIVSCLVKVAIQLQFGKHAIFTGQTVMVSFNKLPGFRIKGTNWSIWTTLLIMLVKIIHAAGLLGGSAVVMHMLFPQVSIITWAAILALAVAVMIFKNYYKLIEKVSLIMIALFTILTIASLIAVLYTPYAFSFSDIREGLRFQLPAELVFLAIGAFGITGVGSEEIISYNYWCIEKGYAAYTGPKEDTAAWKQRAKGWINVMYLDAIVAMVIYTAVTAAFYLLGASILHARGEVPEGNRLIETLAGIYTQTLGERVSLAFLIGAFFVLFSSVFTTLAFWTRMYADMFGQIGWINFFETKQRKKTIAILSFIFPTAWTIAFMFVNSPVMMILFGGVVGVGLLIIVAFAALCYRYEERRVFKRSILFDTLFTLSILSILLVAVYSIIQILM